LTAGAYYTLAVEIGFPFLVWQRRLRYPMIVAALLLHLGIGILMGLHLFSLIMATLVLSFVPPEDVSPAITRLLQFSRGFAGRLWRTLNPQRKKQTPTLVAGPPSHGG
jgi:hypothetical protein